MNRDEMIARMAKFADITNNQAAIALNAFETGVINRLHSGESVSLKWFGVFSVKERASRKGRNPKTGEMIDIPARKYVSFKPGKDMKDAIG